MSLFEANRREVSPRSARSRFELELLEARLLLSGDGLSSAALPPVQATGLPAAVDSYASFHQDEIDQQGSTIGGSGVAYDPSAVLDEMFDTGTSTLPSLAEVGTAQGPAEISESQTAGPNEVVPSLDGAETQIAATDSPSATHASGFLAPQISSDPSLASSTNTVGASVPAAAEELTETLRSANGPPHPELNAVPSANHSTGSTSGPYIDPDLLPGPKQALIDGLTALGNWANTLDNYGKLASSLPLIGSNLGQILDFGGLLLTRLRDPIVAYLNGDPTPTTDELVAALDALDFSGGGLSVQTTGVQGGRVPGQGEFKFDLVFRATRTVSLPINFGPTNDDLDLGIRGSANVDVPLPHG